MEMTTPWVWANQFLGLIHTAIQACLAKIGVEYTMADKESASVPYIHIDDVAFP